MLTERRSTAGVLAEAEPRAASVLVRWLDPVNGRETDAEAALQDILHDGIILVRRSGAALPDHGSVIRLVVMTMDGPFVIHAKVARRIGPNAALVRPMTDTRLQERRRWPRVNLPPVELTIHSDGAAPVSPRVLDLSLRGARFESTVAFSSGDRLSITLRWNGHRISVTAMVIAAVDRGDGISIYRCRFESLDRAAEGELALLINDLQPGRPARVARLHLNRVPTMASLLLLGGRAEGDPFEIRLVELGATTMRFTSGRRLQRGAILQLDIAVSDAPPFVVDAEVTSVEEISGGFAYDAKLRVVSDVARSTILSSIVRFLISERSREN
ncbi:MAG: hypothetical protein KatS3mg060_1574 [Dehalococcoidia bacterium]|nr:MAG: hypothetical protein KatS3mg060_1574 [Dehalococcoidia bacterium]